MVFFICVPVFALSHKKKCLKTVPLSPHFYRFATTPRPFDFYSHLLRPRNTNHHLYDM